mgnify:CR=1 FL=1
MGLFGWEESEQERIAGLERIRAGIVDERDYAPIRQKSFTPSIGLIVGGTLALLLLVGGGAIVLKIIDLLFTPASQAGVPAWMIFAVGFFILIIWKKSKNMEKIED